MRKEAADIYVQQGPVLGTGRLDACTEAGRCAMVYWQNDSSSSSLAGLISRSDQSNTAVLMNQHPTFGKCVGRGWWATGGTLIRRQLSPALQHRLLLWQN
jgi:hypothetical protein